MEAMLYLVSTPIGNPDDITLRALRVLREANAVICEEPREGARLLRHYQIQNELVALNEHTERARVLELIARLRGGQTLALISDHGTPLLNDPGGRLVQRALAENIPVRAVPGASALLAALVVSGLPLERFRFVGFLPAKKEARRAALAQLRAERETWVIFDAPYRLNAVLIDLRAALELERPVVVACNLTMPDEKIVRGKVSQVFDHFQKNPFKGEYVIVIAGKQNRNS
ncbi:MAG: 16S rRNA (cytidine(1402)-2'-O)-methyltransferase [Chloroflexi bacterium]|nr:16S rRNA (cytidine(1402)-2'-O)-methyltransferase [Chloroflexota bacterium]